MQQDLFYQLFLEECLNSFTRLKNLGAWLRGHPLLLPRRQKHDFPKQRQGPFHPTNSLTTAASFLLAFDMLHFVPMTELQSRRGGWRLVSLTLWSVAALPTWNFHHLILWTSEGVASSQTWFTFSFAFCVSKCATASVCFLVQSHGEETTRSRCGLSCVISLNLKWLGWNLSFGFEEFFLLVEPFEISEAIIRKMKNSVLHSHLESPYLLTRFWTLNQWPCHHNHTRLDLCLDSDSALAPHPPKKKKERKKNPKLAFPPPRLCLLGGGGKLTKLILFFPACGCQVGQFPVFLRQLELAVIKARSPSEALLGQTPVRGQQHLPVKLELLKLWGERKTISVKLADIFPSYMQRLSWQPAHEQLCSHSAAQNSESIWAMTHLLQFCLRLWLWCV